jgi:hypothetical protein
VLRLANDFVSNLLDTSARGCLRLVVFKNIHKQNQLFQVARNTKALVAKVGEERFNLLPKVTAHILEAMDRVSQVFILNHHIIQDQVLQFPSIKHCFSGPSLSSCSMVLF